MKRIVVSQCCCGCTVKTGSLIIAIALALLVVLSFVFECTIEKKDANNEEEEEEVIISKGELIELAICNALVFVACLSLIFGILKERHGFILFWLVVYSVYTALIILTTIIVIVDYDSINTLWEVLIFSVAVVVSAYCIIVVYSHYRDLRDQIMLPPRPPLVMDVTTSN